MNDKYELPEEIINLGHELMKIYKIECEELKSEIKYIISKDVHNIRIIENTLDRLLNIPTDEAYKLFMLLCKYYMTIDKEGALFYINSYEEIYGENEIDNEIDIDVKTKKKDYKN